MENQESEASRRFGGWRRESRAFIELFALTGLAVAQPALDALRRNSHDVLLGSGASRIDVIALIAIVLIGPPAVLWGIEVVVGLAHGPRRYAHAALAGLVVGLLVLLVLTNQTHLANRWKALLAIPFMVVGGLLVFRLNAFRMFLRYLAFAPVVFAVLFVLNPQVSPVVLASSAGTADVTVKKPHRVVMIVMDELPLESLLDGTGHVDAGLFPNFAKLAGGSTWYRNTTTVAPHTIPAVPALLSGNYPTHPNALETSSEYPHNLFTLLGGSYSVNAHENLEALNPGTRADPSEDLSWLVHQTYDLWKPKVWTKSTSLATVSQERLPDDLVQKTVPAGTRFVDSLARSNGHHVDYLHVLLPHVPWHYLPDGRSYTDRQIQVFRPDVWSDRVMGASGHQRYLLQLQAADALLGRIIGKLESLGEYDKSLVVVTADHGAGSVDGNPVRKATEANYDQVMWVPLFVKALGQTVGQITDRRSLSIDVLPTLAEMLGVKLPWKVDGQSLLGAPRPDGPRRLLEMPTVHLAEVPTTAVFQSWNGPRGFARVLAHRTAEPGDDQALRIYKGTSPFGDLVGRAAAPLVDSTATGLAGSLLEPGVYRDVDLHSHTVRWSFAQGTIAAEPGREVVVAVNGTVASITTATGNVLGGGYFAMLPPSLVRNGRNDITVYTIEGTPAAPRLVPVTLAP